MSDGVEIFANEYLTARLEYDGKLLRVVRTAVPFPDPEAAVRAYAPLIAIMDRLGRADRCVLSDVRLAPGRNDPAFEAAFAQVRKQAFVGFRKAATLVQSKVGLLQLSRLIKQERMNRMASDNEAELLAYLGFGPTG